jgi:hypothetical protein
LVTAVPALYPTAVLKILPFTFCNFNADEPIATDLDPVSSVIKALYPTATLSSPVVIAVPASSPTTTL